MDGVTETDYYYETAHYMYDDTRPDAAGIVASFFLIASVCVGFPALIYSLRAVYLCRKSGGQTSVFVTFLLFNDLLQLALRPTIIMFSLDIPVCQGPACVKTLLGAFALSQLCGLHFHQLVALESTLSQRYPLYTAHIFSLPCSITLSIFIYIFTCMCVIIVDTVSVFALYLVPFGILIVMFIFSNTKPRPWTLVVATLMMIALHLPYLLTLYLVELHFQYSYYVNLNTSICYAAFKVTRHIMSLRVISDTLLCVLVSRKNLTVQTPQTHIESNTDQR